MGHNYRQIAALIVGTSLSCFLLFAPRSHSQNHKQSTKDLADKTVVVPEFSIAIKLSQAAAIRLSSLKESILVIAYFDGDALPGQGKYNAPFRGVYLGEDKRLVDETNAVRFDKTKLSMSSWNRLSDKNYFVTINVVSARMRSKNNLLDCGVPIDRIDVFRGKVTEIPCGLIGEPSDPKGQVGGPAVQRN